MANAVKTDVKLMIKVNKKNYFTNSNIELEANDGDLYTVAGAINSAQDKMYDQIVKQVTWRLTN